MTPCTHIVAAAYMLLGSYAYGQATSGGIAVDVPVHGAYVGTSIPVTAHSLSPRVSADSLARYAVWESSDPTIAWVTNEGTAVLLRPGKVTLTLRLGTLSGARTLEIRESGARSIAISADRAIIRPNERTRVSVSARDSHGNVIANARPNVGVVGDDASIDANGNFSSRRPGRYVIVAELGGVGSTTEVEVAADGVAQQGEPVKARDMARQRSPVAYMSMRVDDDARIGDEVHVTVDAWARGARHLTDVHVDYAIAAPNDASAASITRNGVFTAHKPGTYTIIASVAGKAERHTLFVRD